METIISPSLLSADFKNLQTDIAMINRSEAQWLHMDVMDGVFVPNISFGFPVISAVKSICKKPLDVHLMIVQPERYIEQTAKSGAMMMTVHQEACVHLHSTLQQIHQAGMKAGVALNPSTSVSTLEDILCDADMFLLMSVNPGFGGQQFIPHTLDKIARLRRMLNEVHSDALIEVDGGVTSANAHQLVEAGANVLVSGSFVFKADNPEEAIRSLMKY